ncbi:putative protein phosphatase 1 regulatory subunit 21 [Scophthalmus maximus]|uniref:Protein phosphatase 1 regulatory subunit 21 n=1 Tax=Scophthalmus maximus TaxID=52904 RepID=A0A2U9CDK6_SCOMX|nr:putative protein phosphatase 1 regulatory subunit 21 [Scophthalmus maximus]
MANVTDLQTKYSKLAQEYSKLRAQNQVLKKAVVDEQANSASFKEQLKQRDQSLRKQEQEMDSLSFRNQQLAKRVELLQEELAASEAKGKKGKSKVDSPSQHGLQTQSVFDEDLQKKIEENERLHIQFYEADEQHRRQEADLRARLDEVEKDSEQHQAVVDGLTTKYMETIERLQGDKARLEVKAQTLEREAKECRMRTEECQQQLRRCQSELNKQVKQSSSVIQEKVPFNDTKLSDYNSLNVPSHNRRHQLKSRDVAGQALGFIQDLVAALLNFHSYTEQRVHIYPLDSSIEPISPLNQKFSQYLHENAAYVRPLEDSFLQLHQSITEDTVTVLETVVNLKSFADNFSSYTHFLQKILPYQLKSLEEECEATLCTAVLTAKNQELQSDMKRVTSVFEKLKSYLNLLALPSVQQDAMPQSSTSAVFTQLASCLHSLHDVIQEMSKHYNQKAGLEQELPTITQKLRTTTECLLGSLASLTSSTGKIATFFSNNLDFFTSSGYSPRGSTLALNPLQAESMLANKKKAAAYIHAVKKPRPQSVPYREALSNRRILTSSTESREGLTQQVQQSQEKIARLEQEKEHWLLEAQLGKVRLEKENQRIADLEVQLAAALGESPNCRLLMAAAGTPAQSHEEAETEQKAESSTLCTSLVGMLCTTPTVEHVGDEESREQLIKTHYMARVGELTTQLQISDSKAVHFHSECRALAKRLAIAETSRETLSEEVKVANQNITRLQDELTTTKRSYEDQLSMMSDHLCSMNETLSKQREEIDTLKLSSKGNAKKNKVVTCQQTFDRKDLPTPLELMLVFSVNGAARRVSRRKWASVPGDVDRGPGSVVSDSARGTVLFLQSVQTLPWVMCTPLSGVPSSVTPVPSNTWEKNDFLRCLSSTSTSCASSPAPEAPNKTSDGPSPFPSFQGNSGHYNPFWDGSGLGPDVDSSSSDSECDNSLPRFFIRTKDGSEPPRDQLQNTFSYVCHKLESLQTETDPETATEHDGERRLGCKYEVLSEVASQFVPRGLFRSQKRDGWSVMLRIPEKKNRMSSRQWGPIYLRLLPGGVLQMYYEKGLEKPYKELQLLPQCRLSDLKLESYGEPRKVLTVRVEHFSFTEKKRYHPKLEVSHEAEADQLLKFGSTVHDDMEDLVVSMEEEIFKLCMPHQQRRHYEEQELSLQITDHIWVQLDKSGGVIERTAFTQIHCLAFLNGLGECFLALNDLGLLRYDSSYGSEEGSELWMEIADCHFHKCVNESEFQRSRLIKFSPPDACRVELMRYKTTTLGSTEIPFSIKAVVTVQGAYVELQAFLNMSATFLSSVGGSDRYPVCENVVIRVPVPGDWVKVTQTVALLRQKSLKARMNRNACLGSVGTANSQPVMQVSIGTVKYENVYSAIVWRIERLPAKNMAVDHPHSFSCKLELGSDQEIPDDWYPFVTMECEIMGSVVSQTRVKSLGTANDIQPQKHSTSWTRYHCQLEVEKKWIETESERQSGCMTQ